MEAESSKIKVKEKNKKIIHLGLESISPDIFTQLELINSTLDYQLSITMSFLDNYLCKYSYTESKAA